MLHMKNLTLRAKERGGALLELSHEFDYTNYLIGKYSVKKISLENCQILKLVWKIFLLLLHVIKKQNLYK